MKLSIVIPSYNRIPQVTSLVKSLLQSETSWDFEIIVIFDQIEDSCYYRLTRELSLTSPYQKKIDLKGENFNITITSSVPLKIVKKFHKTGQGICRNIGIHISTGDYILFLDDDAQIPAENDFLSRRMSHFESIRFSKKVSVGKILFPPNSTELNRVTSTWDVAGVMNCFKGPELEFYQCLSCNLLGHRNTFVEFQFDPVFRNYGYEDVELGYRLKKAGYRIFYDDECQLYHINQKNNSQIARRFHALGRNWVIFESLHPEIIFQCETSSGPVLFDRKFLLHEHEFKETELTGARDFLTELGIAIAIKGQYTTLFNPLGLSHESMNIFWYFPATVQYTLSADQLRRIYLCAVHMKLYRQVSACHSEDATGKLFYPLATKQSTFISKKLNRSSFFFANDNVITNLKMLKVYFNEYSFFNNCPFQKN